MKGQDRERVQSEVVRRIVARFSDEAASRPSGYLQTLINDTLFHELSRLDQDNHKKPNVRRQIGYYLKLRRRLSTASSADLIDVVGELSQRFVAEIVGNFDERIYRLSTRIVPGGLNVLFGATNLPRLMTFQGLGRPVTEHIRIQGEVDHVRALHDRGTVIVVPTHTSHVDSIVVAWAIFHMGIPPLLYGAGINLFTNRILSFFMRNLGAYRVDRKKNARLYKDVLKEYATLTLEYGYDQLFFPGGTRCRSGAVETRLKKGLLGTGVRAYVNNLRGNHPQPNIYIAPCTISYSLVLEAETLIADYLKSTGTARYIIEDDEFSRPRRLLNFFSNVLSLDDEIVVTWGQPMDVFGNPVDREGNSLDPRGRRVSTASYVTVSGEPVVDDQRDIQYTDELAENIADSYLRNNVIRATHLVGRAIFRLLLRTNAHLDLYRLLHTGGRHASFSISDVASTCTVLLDELSHCATKPLIDASLRSGDAMRIIDEALRRYASYHSKAAAVRRGDRIYHEDRNLLYYYSNRLEGYGLA